jgi:TRAP-type mannitol/chloroaromatic compound transport system permease large subunit
MPEVRKPLLTPKNNQKNIKMGVFKVLLMMNMQTAALQDVEHTALPSTLLT